MPKCGFEPALECEVYPGYISFFSHALGFLSARRKLMDLEPSRRNDEQDCAEEKLARTSSSETMDKYML